MKNESTTEESKKVIKGIKGAEVKVDTPENSLGKKFKLLYDIQALPNAMSIDLFNKLSDNGYIFWDSSKGTKPRMYHIGNKGEEDTVMPQFVDVANNEDVDIVEFKNKWMEDEYWRKELYKSQQSPVYFYKEYYSGKAEINQDQINTYMTSIGLREVASDDSDVAAKSLEDQMEARDAFAKTVTLEFMKGRKPQMDELRKVFTSYKEEIIEKAKKIIKVKSKSDEAFHEKATNFIARQSVTGEYSVEAKGLITNGKWDKKVMKYSETHILARIIANEFPA